jgi:polyisoprenoid-binding protein YceI
MHTSKLAVATTLLALAAGRAGAAEWEIDPVHSAVQFSIRHMMVSTVRGNFQKLSGVANLDEQDPTKSTLEVTIDAASIDTREPKRDAHLKSADFFDTAKYPTLTFKSTSVERAGAGKLKVNGNLTMHGQTHPLSLIVNGPTAPVKTPWGGLARGASATAKLNRKEWGLAWNQVIEAGGVAVGEEVQLQIDVELQPKQPARAQK